MSAVILVVDDNPNNLRLLEDILTKHGYKVRCAPSGEFALNAVSVSRPDLILLDINMPTLNGYQVARKLIESYENPAPIIFLSALKDTSAKVRAFTEGGVDFITKPFELDELLSRVATHINLATLRNEVENKNKQLSSMVRELESKNERLEAAYKEVESFSYSASHDLQAPLRHIGSFSEILLEDYADKLDDEGQDYLNRIIRSSNKMKRLIEDLLELSHIADAEVKRESISLSDKVNSIINELVMLDNDRNIELDIEENVLTDADESLTVMVLDNLLRNSWKYSADRDPIRLGFGRVPLEELKPPQLDNFESLNQAVFYISDNGIGFKQDDVETIFKPFERLAPTDKYEGEGIGLSIVKRIIELHGGYITAIGNIDEGAKFYFSLGK